MNWGLRTNHLLPCLMLLLPLAVASRPALAGVDCEGSPGGPPDCNNNGIHDTCDIEACEGMPACDDCNLNGVPDGCDIAASTSMDTDGNGVPDECKFFDGGGAEQNWGDPLNWDDDDVPNDLEKPDDSFVSVESTPVLLDLAVELDTCRVLDGAILSVTGNTTEDFEIAKSGDLQVASRTGMPSMMLLGEGRTVSVVPGAIRVNSGGAVQAGPGTVAAYIDAGSMLVDSRCDLQQGGKVDLEQSMAAEFIGDVVVDASLDCVDCSACSMSSTVAGGKTPPILKIADNARLSVGHDLVIQGAAVVDFTSNNELTIHGSLVNQSPCPACVQLHGRIMMTPPKALVGETVQAIEVHMEDLGPAPYALETSTVVEQIVIVTGATVVFVDEFDNLPGAAGEAIYIDTLVVEVGTAVTVDGCAVYYRNLIDKGGKIGVVGGGVLAPFAEAEAVPVASSWGLAGLLVLILTAGTLVFRMPRAFRA